MCYIIYRTAFSLSEVRIPSGLPEARSCPHAATSSMVITVSTISFLASAQTPPDGVENSRCATNGVAQVSHILADFLSTCFINDQERSAEVFTCECGLFLPALLLGLASCTLELIAQVGAHLGLLILIAFVLQHYEVTYFVPGSRSCSEVSFDISITTPAFFWLVLWQWFLIISYYIFLFSKHPLLFFVMEMALGFPWGYTLSLLKVKMSFFKNELSYGHYLHAIKFNTGRHKNLIT